MGAIKIFPADAWFSKCVRERVRIGLVSVAESPMYLLPKHFTAAQLPQSRQLVYEVRPFKRPSLLLWLSSVHLDP